MNFKDIERQFDALSSEEQWEFILQHKERGVLVLDNDATYFRFNDADKNEGTLYFEAWLSYSPGAFALLKAIGFEAEVI